MQEDNPTTHDVVMTPVDRSIVDRMEAAFVADPTVRVIRLTKNEDGTFDETELTDADQSGPTLTRRALGMMCRDDRMRSFGEYLRGATAKPKTPAPKPRTWKKRRRK